MFTLGDLNGVGKRTPSEPTFSARDHNLRVTLQTNRDAAKKGQVDILLAQTNYENESLRRKLRASEESLNHTKTSFIAEQKLLNSRIAQASAEIKLSRASDADLRSRLASALESLHSASISARLDREAMANADAASAERLAESNDERDNLRLTVSKFVTENASLHTEATKLRKDALSFKNDREAIDARLRDFVSKLEIAEGRLLDTQKTLEGTQAELAAKQNTGIGSRPQTDEDAFASRVESAKTAYEAAKTDAETLSASLREQLGILNAKLPEASRPQLDRYATKLSQFQNSTGRARALAKQEAWEVYTDLIGAPVDRKYHVVTGCNPARPSEIHLPEHPTLKKTHLFAKDDFVMRIGTELVSNDVLDAGNTPEVGSLNESKTMTDYPGYELDTAQGRMTAAVSAVTSDMAEALKEAQVALNGAFGGEREGGEGGERGEGGEGGE